MIASNGQHVGGWHWTEMTYCSHYFPIMYIIIVPVQQQISCTLSVVAVTVDGDIQVKYSNELVCLEME